MSFEKPDNLGNKEKEIEKFILSKGCIGGRSHTCRECTSAYNRERWKKNPAVRKKRMESRRQWGIKNAAYLSTYFTHQKRRKNYGLSSEEWNAKIEEQNNLCAGCGDGFGEKKPFGDHDHATGQFRGILCYRCNTVLGFAADNVPRLEKLIAYLQRFM